MLKSLLALFLVFAVSLLLTQPRSVLAQTKPAESGDTSVPPVGVVITEVKSVAHHGRDVRATNLKAYFDSELRTMKNRSLTSADLGRIEQDSQTPKPKSEFTNKQKILWTLFFVCMAGLVVVLIKHPCREKKPGDCDFVDNSTY